MLDMSYKLSSMVNVEVNEETNLSLSNYRSIITLYLVSHRICKIGFSSSESGFWWRMAQNNGVEIIKGHMATNSDSDGEVVLCTLYQLYHCACQDQDVLPTKQIKIDLNVHEYKWVNPVIMNCSECLEAQWFVITSINIVILSRSLFKRSEVSKIPCKWSEKEVCINLYEAPDTMSNESHQPGPGHGLLCGLGWPNV